MMEKGILEMAVELGRALQNESIFKSLQEAKEQNDQDERLQTTMAIFQEKRMKLRAEAMNTDADPDLVAELDRDVNALYNEIMENEHMQAYAEKKEAFDTMVQQVTQIIAYAANGGDPERALEDSGCPSGGCASCSGCN